MSSLSFKNINKIYPSGVQAVYDFNLEVKDKEFIVLVGPSGCGKTTTLRMVAGLEDITSGEIYIENKLINDVMPKDRNIAMVFQNYALYPHMTVFDNMAFSLKLMKHPFPLLNEDGSQAMTYNPDACAQLERQLHELKVSMASKEEITDKQKEIEECKATLDTPAYTYRHLSKKEIYDKVLETAHILGLEPYLKRKPAALSGGQRQRVALGRAIVRNPKVFLMDEPLSNLDAKLRVQMRSEIIKIHKQVNATTIYVTHDQTEAMTMANRIVCMKDGYIQQIGTPKELFNTPENMFVAGFIGAPSMNFIEGVFDGNSFVITSKESDETIKIALPKEKLILLKAYKDKELVLGVRPEDIFIEGDGEKHNLSQKMTLKCDISELLGRELIIYTDILGQRIIIKTNATDDVQVADERAYSLDFDRIHFFDKETTRRIR